MERMKRGGQNNASEGASCYMDELVDDIEEDPVEDPLVSLGFFYRILRSESCLYTFRMGKLQLTTYICICRMILVYLQLTSHQMWLQKARY